MSLSTPSRTTLLAGLLLGVLVTVGALATIGLTTWLPRWRLGPGSPGFATDEAGQAFDETALLRAAEDGMSGAAGAAGAAR